LDCLYEDETGKSAYPFEGFSPSLFDDYLVHGRDKEFLQKAKPLLQPILQRLFHDDSIYLTGPTTVDRSPLDLKSPDSISPMNLEATFKVIEEGATDSPGRDSPHPGQPSQELPVTPREGDSTAAASELKAEQKVAQSEGTGPVSQQSQGQTKHPEAKQQHRETSPSATSPVKQEKEDSAGDIAASAAQPSHHESAAQAESVLVDTPVKSIDPSTPPPQRVLTRNRLKKGAGKVQLTPMTDAVNKIGKSNMRTKPPKRTEISWSDHCPTFTHSDGQEIKTQW
jgi:hypothetical protein